jgi:hypothetical protein
MKIGVVNAGRKAIVSQHRSYIPQTERKPVAFEPAESLKRWFYQQHSHHLLFLSFAFNTSTYKKTEFI